MHTCTYPFNRAFRRPTWPVAALVLSLLTLTLSSCHPESSVPVEGRFQVLLTPEQLMLQPVAVYTVLGQADAPVSTPCEAVDAQTWACSFASAPVASPGALRLLLGDADDACGLPVQEGGRTCPWPVTFENPTALTGVEARSTLSLLNREDQTPRERFSLAWADTALAASKLWVGLREPYSGLWLTTSTDTAGLLLDAEQCALWESSGCLLPGALEWQVHTALDTGLALEVHPTHWSPLVEVALAVTCPDQDEDGFPLADCGLLPADCADTDATTHPGASEDPQGSGVGDGRDNDCDQLIDEGTQAGDDDGDGFTELQGDCDDADPALNPGEVEVWGDGIDQDCDGTDKLDADGDGHFSITSGGGRLQRRRPAGLSRSL